jgi:hypothetical protein
METRLGHALASVDGWRARTGDIGFVVMAGDSGANTLHMRTNAACCQITISGTPDAVIAGGINPALKRSEDLMQITNGD